MVKKEPKPPPPREVEGSVVSVIGVRPFKGESDRRFVVVDVIDGKLRLFLKSNVTVSLVNWESDHEPKHGQMVVLTGLEKFSKGWRARSARPIILG